MLLLGFVLSACFGSGDSKFAIADPGAGFNKARGFDSYIVEVAMAADGSGDVYVAGTFNSFNRTGVRRLARFNSDGSVDTAFDTGTGFNDYAIWSVVPATDGSGDVYVGGDFTTYNGTTVNYLVRLNDDGSIDTGFSLPGSGLNGNVERIALATDGSGDIYIGGGFTSINGTTTNRLARLNNDGTVDTAFDMSAGGADNYPQTIAPMPDGGVYVGGAFTSIQGTSIAYLARLNSDGSIDNTFDMSAAAGGGANNRVYRIAPATDGTTDIYVVGNFTNINGSAVNYLARLNADGTVDTTFDMSGGGGDSPPYDIVAATDGSGDVFIAGGFTSINGTSINRLARLNTDGTIDNSFDMSGGGADDDVWSIALATDGSSDVYIAGDFSSVNDTAYKALARLNSDGSLDTAFDMSGNSGIDNTVYSIAPASDDSGDIYIGGQFTSVNGTDINRLARLNSNGSLDSGFDMSTGGANGNIRAVVLATDGSGDVYVAGDFTSINGTSINRLARLNSDGSLDSGFDMSGGGANNSIYSLAVATDGSGDIYIGGFFTSINGTAINRLARLKSDGSVDTVFDMSGGGANSSINTIAPAADGTGDVYIGGNFTSINGTAINRLARLNLNGTIDTAFDMSGGGADMTINSIAPATDASGDVYVAGQFTTINAAAANYLVRLNSDGGIDSGFSMLAGGSDNLLYHVVAAADDSGDVYVGGDFTNINGAAMNYLARLNSDGSVDNGFDMSVGPNTAPWIIAPATDASGDVFVGGFFTSINNTTTGYLARMDDDGTVD
jgi:uncharacterized delta-60 repeat protein